MARSLGWIGAAALAACTAATDTGRAADRKALSSIDLPMELARSEVLHTEAGTTTPGTNRHAASNGRVTAIAPLPKPKKSPRDRFGSGVFGSIAIPIGNIPIRRQWDHAVSRSIDEILAPDCTDLRLCESSLAKQIRAIKHEAQGMSGRDLIALVNRRINAAITYKPDSANYGRKEHWASISEVARSASGDCEDYALTKMLLLKALGIASKDMSLVGLKDSARGLYHAVLSVRVDGDFLILDNLTDQVRRDREISHYQPIFSFTTTASYIHGTKGRKTAPRFASIQLGSEPEGEDEPSSRLNSKMTQRPTAS